MSLLDLSLCTEKKYFEGTHRSRLPEETFADFGRYLKEFGITRLANVTGLDNIGLPVFVAVRPNSRTLATSQGKGDSLITAKVSAMMESIETWHGERIECEMKFEAYCELAKSENVVDIQLMPMQKNVEFSENRPIPWALGVELNTNRKIWVPYDSVTVNFVKQAHYQNIFAMTSNGLASGNKLIEAALHGLYEVIERDACTLWEALPFEQQSQTLFDLDSLDDPYLNKTIKQIRLSGLQVFAWDVTSDLGIPTYQAVIIEDPESVSFRSVPTSSGSGTHLDANVALSRAVNEAIQSRLTVISGSRDDQFQSDYTEATCKQSNIETLHLLNTIEAKMTFARHATKAGHSFEADMNFLLEQLKVLGLNSVVVIDLTKPKFNIPVVKVIVPGLEALASSNIRPSARLAKLKKGIQ